MLLTLSLQDSASEQERIWDSRIIRVPSFNYEFGSRVVRELTDDPKLEDEDKFVEYFKTYLYGKGAQQRAVHLSSSAHTLRTAYKTYFCDLGDQEPVVVIIQGKEQPVLGPAVAKKMQSRKVMIISKKVRTWLRCVWISQMRRSGRRASLDPAGGRQGAHQGHVAAIAARSPDRRVSADCVRFSVIFVVPHAFRSDDTIDTDLLDFMTKQIITNYKFGVLYQRAGQTEEDQVSLLSDGAAEQPVPSCDDTYAHPHHHTYAYTVAHRCPHAPSLSVVQQRGRFIGA